MHRPQYFEGQLEKAEKKHQQDPSFELSAQKKQLFFRASDLPEEMAEELFEHFAAQNEHLVYLVDFFTEPDTLAMQDFPFTHKEWQVISELTNRFADEFELDRLQSMYQFFVANHILQ